MNKRQSRFEDKKYFCSKIIYFAMIKGSVDQRGKYTNPKRDWET